MADRFACSTPRIKRPFCRLISAQVILHACQEAAHVFRKRKFDPVLTIHLFLLQVLHGNTAILHLRHLADASVNAAAYCKARMRLPVAVYERLLDYSAGLLRQQGHSLLIGVRRVLLVDAASSLLADTRSIRKLFDQPKNIKPGCGYHLPRPRSAHAGGDDRNHAAGRGPLAGGEDPPAVWPALAGGDALCPAQDDD